eukprot:Pgem_evm1s10985
MENDNNCTDSKMNKKKNKEKKQYEFELAIYGDDLIEWLLENIPIITDGQPELERISKNLNRKKVRKLITTFFITSEDIKLRAITGDFKLHETKIISQLEAQEEIGNETLIDNTYFKIQNEKLWSIVKLRREFMDLQFQRKTTLSRNLVLFWMNPGDITFKSFFSFPSSIIDSEAQINGLLSALLLLGVILGDYYSNLQLPWLYLIPTYGFFVRIIAGPKLSPISWLTILALNPIFVRYMPSIFKRTSHSSGSARRFAQIIGLVMCLVIFGLRLADFYTNNNKSPQQPLYIATLAVSGMFILVCLLNAFFNICLGCYVFAFLIYIKVIPKEKCSDCQFKSQSYRAANESLIESGKVSSLGILTEPDSMEHETKEKGNLVYDGHTLLELEIITE